MRILHCLPIFICNFLLCTLHLWVASCVWHDDDNDDAQSGPRQIRLWYNKAARQARFWPTLCACCVSLQRQGQHGKSCRLFCVACKRDRYCVTRPFTTLGKAQESSEVKRSSGEKALAKRSFATVNGSSGEYKQFTCKAMRM